MSQVPTGPNPGGSSTRPYLVRALHDWCTDNGFTPYIAVFVDASVHVPGEFVKDNEIVLNVGFEATTGLKLGNELIEFRARFGGSSRDIVVPVDHVIAIYARENGQGMAFPVQTDSLAVAESVRPRGDTMVVERLSVVPVAPRLASTDGAAVDAVSGSGVIEEDRDPPEPPSTPGTPGTRPALKRVK